MSEMCRAIAKDRSLANRTFSFDLFHQLVGAVSTQGEMSAGEANLLAVFFARYTLLAFKQCFLVDDTAQC